MYSVDLYVFSRLDTRCSSYRSCLSILFIQRTSSVLKVLPCHTFFTCLWPLNRTLSLVASGIPSAMSVRLFMHCDRTNVQHLYNNDVYGNILSFHLSSSEGSVSRRLPWDRKSIQNDNDHDDFMWTIICRKIHAIKFVSEHGTSVSWHSVSWYSASWSLSYRNIPSPYNPC